MQTKSWTCGATGAVALGIVSAALVQGCQDDPANAPSNVAFTVAPDSIEVAVGEKFELISTVGPGAGGTATLTYLEQNGVNQPLWFGTIHLSGADDPETVEVWETNYGQRWTQPEEGVVKFSDEFECVVAGTTIITMELELEEPGGEKSVQQRVVDVTCVGDGGGGMGGGGGDGGVGGGGMGGGGVGGGGMGGGGMGGGGGMPMCEPETEPNDGLSMAQDVGMLGTAPTCLVTGSCEANGVDAFEVTLAASGAAVFQLDCIDTIPLVDIDYNGVFLGSVEGMCQVPFGLQTAVAGDVITLYLVGGSNDTPYSLYGQVQ